MAKNKKDKKLEKKQALTAGERKAVRGGVTDAGRAGEEKAAYSAADRKRMRRILVVAAALLLVIIVTVSVIIPVWYISDYRYEDNPIVIIQLDNGMTLRYKVYISDSHNLSTNLLFLCSIGYFDGSIIYDTQENWVRFGGYYVDGDGNYAHRSRDEAFIGKTSKYFTDNAGENQFRYRLNRDGSVRFTKNDDTAKYGLFGNSNNFCTEFELLGATGAETVLYNQSNKNSYYTFNVQYLAKAYDEDTEGNIDALLALAQSGSYYKNAFKTPDDPFIKITGTEVHNYSPAYGDSFEKYMTEKNAVTASWLGSYPAA